MIIIYISFDRSNRIRSDGDWRSDCRQLLDMMWQRPDSLPFREPVDTIEFPDYLEIIATPMDLRTVKEDLLGGNYDDPLDFAKDVRLIFLNSKNYNTNKRSRVSPSYRTDLLQQLLLCRSSFISKPMPKNTLHLLRCNLSLQNSLFSL